MLTEGFVAIPRKVVKTKVYDDNEKFAVLIKLFMKARFRDTEIDGVSVKVNQILCTKKSLSEEFGISENKLRAILYYFEKYGYIKTENINNRYTVITLSDEITKNLPVVQKEDEISDVRKKNIGITETEDVSSEVRAQSDIKGYGEFKNVYLTDEEYSKFAQRTGQCDSYINKLSAYLVNHPKKNYESHYALLVSEYEEKAIKGKNDGYGGNCGYGGSGSNIGHDYSFESTASYDIKRAEEWARTHVPKVKKRERR